MIPFPCDQEVNPGSPLYTDGPAASNRLAKVPGEGSVLCKRLSHQARER